MHGWTERETEILWDNLKEEKWDKKFDTELMWNIFQGYMAPVAYYLFAFLPRANDPGG